MAAKSDGDGAANVWTPLHIAAKTTRNGETPLQIAKDSGHDATVYALFHHDVLVSDICMANTNTVDESRLERIDT